LVASVLVVAQEAASPNRPQKAAQHVQITKIDPRPEDVSTIDGIVKAYYDVISGPAGQPRQWNRDHTLYIPQMRFIEFSERKDGTMHAQSMTHQEFADRTEAELGTNAFYEHEVHRIMHRFGNTAHVFSTA